MLVDSNQPLEKQCLGDGSWFILSLTETADDHGNMIILDFLSGIQVLDQIRDARLIQFRSSSDQVQ